MWEIFFRHEKKIGECKIFLKKILRTVTAKKSHSSPVRVGFFFLVRVVRPMTIWQDSGKNLYRRVKFLVSGGGPENRLRGVQNPDFSQKTPRSLRNAETLKFWILQKKWPPERKFSKKIGIWPQNRKSGQGGPKPQTGVDWTRNDSWRESGLTL